MLVFHEPENHVGYRMSTVYKMGQRVTRDPPKMLTHLTHDPLSSAHNTWQGNTRVGRGVFLRGQPPPTFQGVEL